MRRFKNLLTIMMALFMALALSQTSMAKNLGIGSATVYNNGDEASRVVTLDVVTQSFDDVNGLVFTLTYDKEVFEYVGLVQAAKAIDNSDHADDPTPPTADEIRSTIYYQANASVPGRVMIAAAGAEYFAPDTNTYVPFKVQFRVLPFKGSGTYTIGIQKTIIGPDTALNAGYTQDVALPVAAGLDASEDPSEARVFDNVAFSNGSITVTGGYTLKGAVGYEGEPDDTPADNVEVQLFKKVDSRFAYWDATRTVGGAYSFKKLPEDIYQIRVNSLKPGYQRTYLSEDINVPENLEHNVSLAAYKSLTGTVSINGAYPSGLKVKVTKADGTLVGYYNVDSNGQFVTSALPGTKADYLFYAVYGGTVSQAFDPDTPFSFDTISLGMIKVQYEDLSGKTVMIHVIQEDGQLEKIKTQEAVDNNPVLVDMEDLIAENNYIVSIVADGIPVTYYDSGSSPPQSTDYSAADHVQATIAGTPIVSFAFPDLVANKISGTVQKDNSPVSGVRIYAVSSDYSNVSVAISGEQGEYTLEVVPGQYMVYASYQGDVFYYMDQTASTLKYAEHEVVSAQNSDATSINLFLDKNLTTAYFYGKVTEKQITGLPAPYEIVVAESADRIAVSQTGTAGNYRLEKFMPDEAATLFVASFPDGEKQAAASDDGTEVNFVINQGFTISGTVQVGASGLPVSGATIYLTDADGLASGLPVKSGTNGGAFALKDVASGLYTLHAFSRKYKKYAEDISVMGDKDVVIELEPGAYIHGTVKTDDSQPLENASVLALGASGSHRTHTDSDGIYRIEGLENQEPYEIFASKRDYTPAHESGVTAKDTDSPVDLQMPKVVHTYTLSGIVTVNSVNVADGTKVTVYSKSKNVWFRTFTSAGNYVFSELMAASDYVVTVFPAGQTPVSQTVNLSSDKTDADIPITNTTISGNIILTGSGENTGKTVTVYLVSESNVILKTLPANDLSNGSYHFEFAGIQTSVNYRVAAFSPGYSTKWFNGGTDFSSSTQVLAGTTTLEITLESE